MMHCYTPYDVSYIYMCTYVCTCTYVLTLYYRERLQMVKVRTYVMSTPWQSMDVRTYIRSSNLRPPNRSVSPTYICMLLLCHVTWTPGTTCVCGVCPILDSTQFNSCRFMHKYLEIVFLEHLVLYSVQHVYVQCVNWESVCVCGTYAHI